MPASLTPYADNGLLDVGDFIELDELLHPLAVGPIAILFLFGCLRLSSNRTVAPLTIWDGICSMALGSVCHLSRLELTYRHSPQSSMVNRSFGVFWLCSCFSPGNASRTIY